MAGEPGNRGRQANPQKTHFLPNTFDQSSQLENGLEENPRVQCRWVPLKESRPLRCCHLSITQTLGPHFRPNFEPGGGGGCRSLETMVRTKTQFLTVNSPSSVKWHWRSFFLACIHLFSFSLFFLPLFFVSSLRCPNEFTGDRCQNYVMASFYSTSTPFLSLPD